MFDISENMDTVRQRLNNALAVLDDECGPMLTKILVGNKSDLGEERQITKQ